MAFWCCASFLTPPCLRWAFACLSRLQTDAGSLALALPRLLIGLVTPRACCCALLPLLLWAFWRPRISESPTNLPLPNYHPLSFLLFLPKAPSMMHIREIKYLGDKECCCGYGLKCKLCFTRRWVTKQSPPGALFAHTPRASSRLV